MAHDLGQALKKKGRQSDPESIKERMPERHGESAPAGCKRRLQNELLQLRLLHPGGGVSKLQSQSSNPVVDFLPTTTESAGHLLKRLFEQMINLHRYKGSKPRCRDSEEYVLKQGSESSVFLGASIG